MTAAARGHRRKPVLRWLAVVGVAALILLAIERGFGGLNSLDLSFSRSPPASFTGPPKNYDDALARIDLHLADARQRAESLDDGWLVHDAVARAWMGRARLTGSYQDYSAAAVALEKAFSRAQSRAGPHETAASLAIALHSLAEAERHLEAIDRYAVPSPAGERAEAIAMRGDIAFFRGDYAKALLLFDEADWLVPGAADFRRAVYYSKTGRPDLAEIFYDKAERGLSYPTPQTMTRMEMQRGVLDLDRGRWSDAMVHFRNADRIFPGDWLIEEHIAEVTALKGDLVTAERLYRDIVRRTGNPEFMDALASIARMRGDGAAASRWTQRAAREWRERLRHFPEAAYGHALDHCVQKADWSCALNLARRNHNARPYGDAKVLLAQVLLLNDRKDEARALIETVLASPWRTAQLHAVAAEIYDATGDTYEVREQRRLALAINPHALDAMSQPSSARN